MKNKKIFLETVTITIPKPMTVAPKYLEKYFYRSPATPRGYESSMWDGLNEERAMLAKGIWATEEEMEQVIEADRAAVN